mmetsp:Transcript_133088/g.344414  ORF Transcript_133088/g.344414 Transcript_133088/m.344414 type:complete len:116 (+) Transcript_133088:831-1178(+)
MSALGSVVEQFLRNRCADPCATTLQLRVVVAFLRVKACGIFCLRWTRPRRRCVWFVRFPAFTPWGRDRETYSLAHQPRRSSCSIVGSLFVKKLAGSSSGPVVKPLEPALSKGELA